MTADWTEPFPWLLLAAAGLLLLAPRINGLLDFLWGDGRPAVDDRPAPDACGPAWERLTELHALRRLAAEHQASDLIETLDRKIAELLAEHEEAHG